MLLGALARGRRRLGTMSSMSVFDRRLKQIQKDRAAVVNADGEFDYLRDEVARRVVDRIDVVQREFPKALDLGCNAAHFRKALFDGIGGIESIVHFDQSEKVLERCKLLEKPGDPVSTYVQGDEEALPFEPESFDIIVSSLSMHWINDLPSTLRQARQALKPDGLFIGAMLGGSTLKELKMSFALAEQEREGGMSSHVSPVTGIADVGNLLQDAGFALATVDSEELRVGYPDVFVLMRHLQGMGEGNALLSRTQMDGVMPRMVSRDTFLATAALYQQLYGEEPQQGQEGRGGGADGGIVATFEVVYFVGWRPHESQQKPLARGSAQYSMRDIGSSSAAADAPPAAAGASSCSSNRPATPASG